MNTHVHRLRRKLAELPTELGDQWDCCWKQLFLDQLHYLLDRQVPYFLHRRTGAPRITWESGRNERALYARLEGLQHARRGGYKFVHTMVDTLLTEVKMITEYVQTGRRGWMSDSLIAA